MPKVKVGDINIHYEIHGEGEPLILIAGHGLDLSSWTPQIPAFSEKHRVVAFDNRGAGRTDVPDSPYTIEAMASDTVGLLDALSIDEAHVCGISMGGYIAQELAIRHPHRVKKLVLAATAARKPPESPRSPDPQIRSRELLRILFTDDFLSSAASPSFIKGLVSSNSANPLVQAGHSDACDRHDTLSRLRSIVAPTLVIVGRGDGRYLIPAQEMAKGILGSVLVILEGGKHGFSWELADLFNETVLSFLATRMGKR